MNYLHDHVDMIDLLIHDQGKRNKQHLQMNVNPSNNT